MDLKIYIWFLLGNSYDDNCGYFLLLKGYGDVIPVTIEEKIFTIIFIIIGCIIFGYILN